MLKVLRGYFILLLIVAVMVAFYLLATQSARAQGRVCNPFTTTPDAGMVATGTAVRFNDWGTSGPFTRAGVIEAYYIASCFPGVPPPGLEAQAYVISYGESTQVVLNRNRFEVQ